MSGVTSDGNISLTDEHFKIIEVSEEGPPTTGKRKRSPNGTRKEQVTLSKLKKSIRDLAIAGHDYLHMYIATQNAFPDSTSKASFSWKRMEEAVASHQELKKLMEDAVMVQKTKEMLIDYVPPLLFSIDLILTDIPRCGRASHQ